MGISDEERATASEVHFLPRYGAGDYADADLGSDEAREWHAFIDEMGDAVDYAKVMVYREPTGPDGQPKGKSFSYLFECTVDAFTFSQLCARLRDEYGTGVYRIQMRDKGGTIRKNQRVSIEAPKGADVARTDSGGNIIEQMARAMEAQQRRFDSMMERMSAGQVARDPFDQMTKMMAAMGTMMGAIGINPAGAQREKSMVETLTELKMQRELMRDLFNEGGEGEAEATNFWGAISKLAGPLVQALALAQKSGAIDSNGIVQPRALAHNPAPAPDDSASDDMKQKLQFLVAQASAGVEAADVVAFVVESLPDDEGIINGLTDFLAAPTCIDQCIAMHAPVEKHRAWFDEWRRLMMVELEAMYAEDPAPPDLTGDDVPADDTAQIAGHAGADAGLKDAAAAAASGAKYPDGNT